jgi:tetratricopeptide (TPR) repeat protein
MTRPLVLLFILLLSLLSVGCANPINDISFHRHYSAGAEAFEAGNLEAAEKEYGRAAMHAQVGFLGANKENASIGRLAAVKFMLGKDKEAEELFLYIKPSVEQEYGRDSDQEIGILEALGEIYLAQERYSEAEQSYRDLLERAATRYTPDTEEMGQFLVGLAKVYAVQGRYSDGEASMERAASGADRFKTELLREAYKEMLDKYSDGLKSVNPTKAKVFAKRSREYQVEQHHAVEETYRQYVSRAPNDLTRLPYLCRAADAGHPNAQMEVGRHFAQGNYGIQKDVKRAYVWYSLADSGGSDMHLQLLLREMTSEQITEAKRMLADWKPGQCEHDLIPAASGN